MAGEVDNPIEQISNWRDFLKESEMAELLMIARLKQAGQRQTRRIYDRCRKRMKNAERTDET